MSDPVRASEHTTPEGVSEETIEGVGRLSEAFEYIERAKGHLYSFHQLMGRADFLVEEAADILDEAGHTEFAHRLRTELVGRNVLDGRWTFQVVEEFDDVYYEFFRGLERESRELTGGVRHLYEARMKEQRRTKGHPEHSADPQTADPS
jgi:hypothetical protein